MCNTYLHDFGSISKYSIWFDTERLEFYAHSFHPSVIFLLDKFFTNELLKVKN